MPQLVLFVLLPFAICNTLTKISEKPIQQQLSASFASSYYWYLTATNEIVRLSETTSKSVPVPQKLINYNVDFLETNDTSTIIYAPSTPASIPFYWTDGDTTREYDFYSNYSTHTRERIYHIVSNSRNYILSVFSYGAPRKFYESSCVCLETGTITTVTTNMHESIPVIVHNATGSFYLLHRYNVEPLTVINEFIRYDPYLNEKVILDSYASDNVRYFHQAYDSILYPYVTSMNDYGIKCYNTATNVSTYNATSIIMGMAFEIPTKSHPQQYIISTNDDYSYICNGELASCKQIPLSVTYGSVAFISDENKCVYIHHHYRNKILYYSFDSLQGGLYNSLPMKPKNARSFVMHTNLNYHEKSNSVWFTGYESFQEQTNFNLFKLDLKTKAVIEITNLCTNHCGPIGSVLYQRNGTIYVVKGDEEKHLYKIEFSDTPTLEPKRVGHVPMIVLLGSLFFVTLLIGFVVAIRWFIRKTPSSEPYESVVH